jgi:hypothetical protein
VEKVMTLYPYSCDLAFAIFKDVIRTNPVAQTWLLNQDIACVPDLCFSAQLCAFDPNSRFFHSLMNGKTDIEGFLQRLLSTAENDPLPDELISLDRKIEADRKPVFLVNRHNWLVNVHVLTYRPFSSHFSPLRVFLFQGEHANEPSLSIKIKLEKCSWDAIGNALLKAHESQNLSVGSMSG